MKALEKMNRGELIKLVNAQKDVMVRQQKVAEDEVAMRKQAQEEAQGTKVMLSMLVQMQGGVVEFTDIMVQAFKFDLRIVYDPKKELTWVMSNPADNVLAK